MKINIKLMALLMAISVILILSPFVSAQDDDDDFISVSPVEKTDTGTMMEEDIVTKIEKPKPKPTAKPAVKTAPSLAKIDNIITTDLADKVKVRITTSKKVKFKSTELTSPSRILLQLENCQTKSDTIKSGKYPVKKVRTAPHDSTAWIVIDLDTKSKWKTAIDGNKIIVDVIKSGKVEKPAVKEPVKRTAGSMIYRVLDIASKDLENKTRVIITTDGPVKYRMMKDSKNEKLILNIIDSVNMWGGKSSDVKTGIVEGISVKEDSKGKVVDISIELEEDSPYTVTRDQNQIVVDIDHNKKKRVKTGRKLDLNQKISLNIQNASLPGVLRLLATQTGFEFVASPSVSNASPVTIREDNQPLQYVLRDILLPQNLYYDVRDNIIKIGNVAELKFEKSMLPKITRFYYPGSMGVSELEALLKLRISKSSLLDIAMQVDTTPGSNRLMLVGTPDDVAEVIEMAQQMDGGGSVKVQNNKGVVMDDDSEGGGWLKTRIFKLQNIRLAASPDSTFEQTSLGEFKSTLDGLKSENGTITYDNRTSSIVVTDTIDTLRKFERVLRTLDVRLPQVSIEAKLYEVNVQEAKELGINWSAESQSTEPYIKGESLPTSVAGVGKLAIETLQNGFNVSAYLDALETQTHAKLLSSPKITVASNRPAKIETTRSTSYKTSTVTYPDVGPPVITNSFTSVTLPITLDVVPKVVDDGTIDMKVKLNVVKLLGSTFEGPPETSQQSADTSVKAKNNETIVIGGLITERKTVIEEKVPILGDIPLLGELFKGKKENTEKVELVVFITPSIIED